MAAMIVAQIASLGVLAFVTLSSAAPAQQALPATRMDTVTAGAHYRAGWFHRLLLGAHYRDLWATPIEVPVIDLSRFAGGLTPNRCGGRRQTKSLRLLGADGRQYVFRSVDKDPTLALPPELRRTFARQLIQDQIIPARPSSSHRCSMPRGCYRPRHKSRSCPTIHACAPTSACGRECSA